TIPHQPSDGRWSADHFRANQGSIKRWAAALARPDEEGPVTADDVNLPPVTRGPLVTLIVRTYKGRRPLTEIALKSIRDQIYRPIAGILVEDGGADCAVLDDRFICGDDIIFRHMPLPKVGRSAAANAGLAAATGDLIGFLDDDDYLLPDHCARLVGGLIRHEN